MTQLAQLLTFVALCAPPPAAALKAQQQVAVHSHAQAAAAVQAHASALAQLFAEAGRASWGWGGNKEKKEGKEQKKTASCNSFDLSHMADINGNMTQMSEAGMLAMSKMFEAKANGSSGEPPKFDLPHPEGFQPKEVCDPKKMMGIQGMRWKNMEQCWTEGLGFSATCSKCPVSYLKGVIGGDALSMPFSCAPKCSATMMMCAKEAKVSNKCLKESVGCMKCMQPKMVKLEECTGADSGVEQTMTTLLQLMKTSDVEKENGVQELMGKIADQVDFSKASPGFEPKKMLNLLLKVDQQAKAAGVDKKKMFTDAKEKIDKAGGVEKVLKEAQAKVDTAGGMEAVFKQAQADPNLLKKAAGDILQM